MEWSLFHGLCSYYEPDTDHFLARILGEEEHKVLQDFAE